MKNLTTNLTEQEIYYLLREIISHTQEILLYENDSFKGLCGYAADILGIILERKNIKFYQVNIRGVIKSPSFGHAITIVNFKNGNDNMYVIDPTYQQFMSNPNFVKATKLITGGVDFADNLVDLGYFKLTLNNLKTYFDIFRCYKELSKEKDISLSRYQSGQEYCKLLFKCPVHENYPLKSI